MYSNTPLELGNGLTANHQSVTLDCIGITEHHIYLTNFVNIRISFN